MNGVLDINRLLVRIKREHNFPYPHYFNKNQIIFIHIPKTAGTAVLAALGKKGNRGRNHLPWHVYYTSNSFKFDRFFKFSFVRNPWDRVYSSYEYLVNGGNNTTDTEISNMVKKFTSFDDFVINGLDKGMFRSHLLFLPQSNFIMGPNGKVVVDFVGRYENIDSDFYSLMKKLSLNVSLEKKNVHGMRQYKNFISAYKDQKSVSIIDAIYREDIKNFDYQFKSD